MTFGLIGLRSYRFYPSIGGLDGSTPTFDTIARLVIGNERRGKAALASDAFTTAVADGINFHDTGATHGYFSAERSIV